MLVAPPQVLGALRDAWTDDLAAETVAEIAKTLTGHPVARITEIVADDLAAGFDAFSPRSVQATPAQPAGRASGWGRRRSP